ncbi:Hypothetical_protein [Hexamita inflata]|uniref:Hypothetical_protein n=1 Tax=Hexamita inflata TaxID=28002 RepID=A0ABP1HI19_9EUKA
MAQTDFIETFESKTQSLARQCFHFQNGLNPLFTHTQQRPYISHSLNFRLYSLYIFQMQLFLITSTQEYAQQISTQQYKSQQYKNKISYDLVHQLYSQCQRIIESQMLIE